MNYKVRFKTQFSKPIRLGVIGTYRYYAADNLNDAREFLESVSVTEDFLYYEVETPEGNLGKDIVGIY